MKRSVAKEAMLMAFAQPSDETIEEWVDSLTAEESLEFESWMLKVLSAMSETFQEIYQAIDSVQPEGSADGRLA